MNAENEAELVSDALEEGKYLRGEDGVVAEAVDDELLVVGIGLRVGFNEPTDPLGREAIEVARRCLVPNAANAGVCVTVVDHEWCSRVRLG